MLPISKIGLFEQPGVRSAFQPLQDLGSDEAVEFFRKACCGFFIPCGGIIINATTIVRSSRKQKRIA